MTSRRSFLKTSLAAAAAGSVLRPSPVFADTLGMIYGVQLYMFRRQAVNDLPGALRIIRDAGFAQVELYPVAYNHPVAELRHILEDSGLGAVSGHFDYQGLESKVDFAHQIGLKYMVCPMLPKAQWDSLDGFRQAAALFNKVGSAARERGMEFAFHNHDYDFKPIDGSTGFDTILKDTDPALVKLELDMYWLTQAGQDPLQMLKTHADRVRLVHLKDRLASAPHSYNMDPPQYFTELGRGAIDWRAILAQARAQGIRYAFLDQDDTTIPIPESLRISRAYLRTLHL